MKHMARPEPNTSSPLVSIIIPTYNRGYCIAGTIGSALAQTYPNVEIVVSDNDSLDDTQEIVETLVQEHPNIRYIKQERNIGPIPNWETGVRESRGTFVKLLFSDDQLHPTCLEALVAGFHRCEDVCFSFGKVDVDVFGRRNLLYDKGEEPLVFPSKTYTEETGPFADVTSRPVSPSCALFRRETVLHALTFAKSFANDWERHGYEKGIGPDLGIFLHSCLEGKHVVYVGSNVCIFTGGVDSITMNTDQTVLGKGYLAFYGKFCLERDHRFPIYRNIWKRARLLSHSNYGAIALVKQMFGLKFFLRYDFFRLCLEQVLKPVSRRRITP